MSDVLTDSLLDSVKIFPFILLIYILMEVIESAKNKEKIEKALSGYFAPAIAGATGIIPQCGFAVAVSKLYDKGLVKTGTLISAFIAISDEGLILLIGKASAKIILLTIAIKIVYATVIGEILNVLLKNFDTKHVCPEKDECIECGEHLVKPVDKFLLHPLFHSLKILVYVFLFNFIFGTVIHFIGNENIIDFMQGTAIFEPFVTSLVGLIPNCASSTIIASAYNSGILSFSGLLAGLTSNAGVGLIFLFKNRKNIKKNILIITILYICAVAIGFIVMPFNI